MQMLWSCENEVGYLINQIPLWMSRLCMREHSRLLQSPALLRKWLICCLERFEV